MKLKKLLNKKLDSIKDFILDQTHYAKEGFKDTAKVLGNLSKGLLFTGLMLFCGLGGQLIHSKYIELKVSSSVVSIHNPLEVRSGGTGFHMKAASGKTVIVTNAHICRMKNEHNEVLVFDKLHSGRYIPRKVLEIYPDNDLCVMEALPGYPALELGDAPELSDNVIAIGYPLLEALDISKGRIKSFHSVQLMSEDIPLSECEGPRLHKKDVSMFIFQFQVCVEDFEATNTSVVIYPGNSGSPLVNMYGNVVGVIFAGNTMTNWGEAVAYKDLVKLLRAF